MILVDANLLLYTYDASAPQQARAAAWLEELLHGGETVALAWVTIWAFVRIATNARSWRHRISAADAFDAMSELRSQASVVTLDPGPRH